MNEVLKTIAERYSCRSYDGKPVEREKLEAMALAAVQAPSGMNSQPWRIVVITDKKLIDDMDAEGMAQLAANEDKSAYERFMGRGGKLFYNAPCMFLILEKTGSAGASAYPGQNIALAAASLGLGGVLCGMASIPFNGPKGDEFKKKAGFTEGWDFGLAVLVGYASVQGKPHEPDITKISYV